VKKSILSYSEFLNDVIVKETNNAKNITKTTITSIQTSESVTNEDENLNEGFLDAVLRFFKGIFDLFSDKEVKKEAEESQKYFSDLENDDNLTDEELEDEIDPKFIRNTSVRFSKSIRKRVETDDEKGIRTSKDLVKSFSSWLGMILVYEESIRMPLIEKMTKNPELAKRFTWVPLKYSRESNKLKDWYKSEDCKPDPKILKALVEMSKIKPEEKKSRVKQFAEAFINIQVKQLNIEEEFKDQDKEWLDNLHSGLAAMANGIIEAMQGTIKNTQDAKLTEVVANEMIQNRKRRGKNSKVEDKKPTETTSDSGESRSRKSSKKTTPTSATKTETKKSTK
jgi:hypothetical protein